MPKIALWSTNLGRPAGGVEGWCTRLETKMVGLATCGVDLLMLPEVACAQWLADAPHKLVAADPLGYLAREGKAVVPRLLEISNNTGVDLLAGTMPAEGEGGKLYNRAFLLTAQGDSRYQDKLFLTPVEQQLDGGQAFTPGQQLHVFRWRGLKTAIAICLDVEVPAVASALQQAKVELLLVPSRNDGLTGYNRVFACARARAIELQAYVAAVGAVGTLGEVTNVSGAAIYGPCEAWGPSDGIWAAHPPQADADDFGPMLIGPELSLEELRKSRAGGAEVWPGYAQMSRNIVVFDVGN